MNVSIPLIPSGYFVARHDTIGLSEEEIAAAERGTMLPESRRATVQSAMEDAIGVLTVCATLGNA